MHTQPVIVIGAGPAGLTAALKLCDHGLSPLVLEETGQVGGLARTESYHGYRFDIGGHRFFTQVPEVQALWERVIGNDFLAVPRLSRIRYKDRFFLYPLDFRDALINMGLRESVLITLSFLSARLHPLPREDTFEQWVVNRFGRRLYEMFFKTYTEKVWGIPCDKIQADWAAQRIRGLSLTTAIRDAIFGDAQEKTLIKEFQYPRLGPGMMWQRFREKIEAQGGEVRLSSPVTRIRRDDHRVLSITTDHAGQAIEVPAAQVISSMPLQQLCLCLDPPPPPAVLQAVRSLRYRAFILVALMVDRPDLFPDNWIYVHTPELSVGRIQNFKNWSPEMVPDPRKSCLGLEYFCDEGDALWSMPDADLLQLGRRELCALHLAQPHEVEDGTVIRQAKAYPVYDGEYRRHLTVIRDFLGTLGNLQTIGRNGMHRYNNQDHSMLTAMLAVKNLLGEKHDLWNVNTERSYHEDVPTERSDE